ncbi:monocarboxylate transporter 12 isoform X3 [Zootermopsis nevadensis]|uniref:monocarboxylate transporter 12 isoform X3 n=1 Tax=Zootermopsis nevadensis TaxID=136037 RepID=UPI000B8E2B58|nr:monocarboxylate transporter 12 isoform X3 [Zootermopsis nevadensis]
MCDAVTVNFWNWNFVAADGVTYSFGVFYLTFLHYFNEGKGTTAWIASILVGVTLCSGPISSSFVNKYGCRAVTIAGSLLAAVSLMISVFAQNVLTLYLTIGLGAGFGFGLIYLPAIVSVTCYFEKYRSLATGIAVCGSGLGTFLFAPISEYLITEYGWRGALLIIAAVVLNCIILGALFRPIPDIRESKPVSRAASSSAVALHGNAATTNSMDEKNSSEQNLHQVISTSVSKGDDNALHRPRSIGHFMMPYSGKMQGRSNAGTSDVARLALSQPILLSTSASMPDPHLKPTFGSQSLRKSSGIMYRRDIFYRGSLHNIPYHRRKRGRSCTWPGHGNFRVLGLRPGGNTFFKQGPMVVSYSSNKVECHMVRLGSNVWLQQDIKHGEESHQLMELKGSKQRQDDDDRMTICGCSKETRDTLTEMLDFSLLKDPIFILFTISNFCTSVGFNIPYVYLVAQAEERGISTDKASLLLAVIGIANLIGRIILGYVSDKPWINRLMVYNVCLTICGVATAFSALCYEFYSFVIYASIYGFTIGAYVGLTSVILVDLLGLDRLTNAFGLLLLFQGIASFLGPPVAGWLYDALQSYNPGFYVAGITIAASGIMLFCIPSLQRYVMQRRNSKSSQKLAVHQNGSIAHSAA